MLTITTTTKPGKKYASIRNPRVYEALRKRGMSKQRAARISNAQANKDAGTVAGPMLSGPGGLLGTPGMGRRGRKWGKKRRKPDDYPDQSQFAGHTMEGWNDFLPDSFYKSTRKWGNRRKDKACTCGVVTKGEQIAPGITRIRGNLCNVHGRYGPCDAGASTARKPKGKKGRAAKKPVKTPEQRLAERQAAQAENRSKVLSQLGLPEDAAGALEDLRSGIATDDDGGLVKMGLAEQAADGSYRLTASGRALANAASQGDIGRARDTISGARDRLGARQGRQAAAEQRKQEVAARRAAAEAARQKRQTEAQKKRGGGGSKQTNNRGGEDRSGERARREQERQADRERRLSEHQQDRERRLREHEEDRARREQDRADRTQQQLAQRATAPAERVSGARPGVQTPSRKHGRLQRTNVGVRTKAETYGGVKRSNLDDDVFAGPDRSFPIKIAQDVRDAVRSLGRTKHDKEAVKRGIIRRARAIGATDALPESWRSGEKSFTVFKSDDGSYRWIARSTTAYRDRDNEIITTKALEDDAARMTATGLYGPLRYWHLGMPDPFDPTAPWGPGVDIGDCDYSTVIGKTSVESGTFKSADIGAAFAASADDYELSPGFFHPVDQPTASGEYEAIRRFERSVVPVKYGRASNLFTGMTVKEHRMDQNEYERRMKAFAADMQGKGVPPEVAGQVIAGMERADKSAQAQGIAYKADDPWQAVIAALKAAMAPASMEEAADTEMDDALTEQADEGDMPEDDGEYIGDMSPATFKAMMGEMLAPVLKMQDMLKAMSDMHGELKGMMGGATTKSDAADAAYLKEVATLKADQAKIAARLAQLEGDQPAVVGNVDIAAALKGAPAAPPDPNAPIVPKDDPSRPYAEIAARTFPNLYRQNPDGSFGGWQAPMSNS